MPHEGKAKEAKAKSTTKEEVPKLEHWQVKELLIDLENAGGRESGDQNFLEICNNNIRIYGIAGSPLRRAFQFKRANFKRKKIHSYLKTLREHGVLPGVSTLSEQANGPTTTAGELRVDAVICCCFFVCSPRKLTQ